MSTCVAPRGGEVWQRDGVPGARGRCGGGEGQDKDTAPGGYLPLQTPLVPVQGSESGKKKMWPNRSVFKILMEGLQRTFTDWLVKLVFFFSG